MLTNFKPIKIGSKYVVKLEKFPKSTYLSTTTNGIVIEVSIELAKELDTLQEVIDLAYAYTMNIKYRWWINL